MECESQQAAFAAGRGPVPVGLLGQQPAQRRQQVRPRTDAACYPKPIAALLEDIAAGDVYQVNLTGFARARTAIDPFENGAKVSFEDKDGNGWLCDKDIDPEGDFEAQGCWRCEEMAFPTGGR